MGHTPTPWQSRGIDILAVDSYGDFVAIGQCNSVASFASTPYIVPKAGESFLNAAFIVECVNSHATLTTQVAALTAALEKIAVEGDEENEWDAVNKFHRARDLARAELVELFNTQAAALKQVKP